MDAGINSMLARPPIHARHSHSHLAGGMYQDPQAYLDSADLELDSDMRLGVGMGMGMNMGVGMGMGMSMGMDLGANVDVDAEDDKLGVISSLHSLDGMDGARVHEYDPGEGRGEGADDGEGHGEDAQEGQEGQGQEQGEGGDEGGEVDNEEPLYVNAKQYHRILKRRMARARLEELNRLSRSRKVSLVCAPFLFGGKGGRRRR